MRILISLAAVCAISGCSVAQDIAQTTVRNETKAVINAQVAQSFPGVNAAPITDCIVDSASTLSPLIRSMLLMRQGSMHAPMARPHWMTD